MIELVFFVNCNHFDFESIDHKEHVIASYHSYRHITLGIQDVEQFVIYMAAYELVI
jgi:hypothetical protein